MLISKKTLSIGMGVFLCMALVAFEKRFCTPIQAFCAATTTQTTEEVTQLAPRYFAYSQASLVQAHESGNVFLYFWAPWCSTCASLDLDIRKDPELIPKGNTILRIDYDSSPQLRAQYGVVTQHTFVQVDRKGTALQQWVGGDAKTLKQHLQ